MAEGWLHHLAGDRFDAHSAGTHPSRVNPAAIRVMAEKGVDISGHSSKGLDRYVGTDLNAIITVCDNARMACPNFSGQASRIHWSIPDPFHGWTLEENDLDTFRDCRDLIESKVREFIASETG